LAFHLYSQLIREYCNIHRFVPPLNFSFSFKLVINRSPGFGSYNYILSPFLDSFSLRILLLLYSHILITCKSIIQKVRGIPSALYIQFPALFHYALLFFFNFHSRYLFTIGKTSYLALEVDSPLFKPLRFYFISIL